MDKNLNNTERWLEEQLPVNVASRVSTSLIQSGSLTCEGFFTVDGVSFTDEEAAAVCEGEDLSDVNTVKGIVNATWYGSLYSAAFQTKTGMNKI